MGGMFPSTQALKIRLPFAPEFNAGTPSYSTYPTVDADTTICIFKPDGTEYFNDVVTAASGNLTISKHTISGGLGRPGLWDISIAAADAVDGVWVAFVVEDASASILAVSAEAQWGGLADLIVAINTQTQPGGTMYESVATTEATTGDINVTLEPGGAVYDKIDLTRKYVGNKWEANSSTVPTYLILYDDDGTTAMASRNIANADGTAVSPAQVLNLGEIA